MKNDFGKIVTAMVTPFDNKNNLDIAAIKGLVNHLEKTGSESLVLAGTTGEGPTLTENEKMILLKEVLKQKAPETKIIMNVGTNNTNETILNAKKWSEQDGVDGIMVVCPYYNKPSQRGLYAHFEAVNRNVNKPIMVYHIPGRTNVIMESDTMIKVARLSNVSMLKDAEGNIEKLSMVISDTKEDWFVYSGDDPSILEYLEIGAKGVVSVASHIKGSKLQELFTHFENGNKTKAREVQKEIKDSSKFLFPSYAPNPVPIKYALSKMKMINSSVRLPLTEMDVEEKDNVVNGLRIS
ncbi:4-hydroxy-tetrahydrodipicolinate synthase [Bacillus mexicanus]|uniref:4-hydroxy-tetrahydrodipicolinate synthase n=1 Tax=Bacillus mexicanus TaxID=2834415 RepID=UPI003D19D1AB